MAKLTYEDGIVCEVFDHVALLTGAKVFDARVTKLHPKLGEVSVRYEDYTDTTRTGEPKTKSARVSPRLLELVRRDG